MKEEVQNAVRDIRFSFSGCAVTAKEDGEGGAIVIVYGVSLQDSPYEQDQTWVGFHITHTYPYADVYPHFVRADLKRKDGKPLGEGTSVGTFQENSALQLSRKSNHLNPATDTAALKLHKVLRWLRSR
jgi:hypothetical protein